MSRVQPPQLTRAARTLLAKALRAIERRPETFDMANFIQRDPRVKGYAPYCGTVACLAGHIVLAARFPPQFSVTREDAPSRYKHLFDSVDDGRRSMPDLAIALLNLSPTDEQVLFYVADWPAKYRDAYDEASRPRAAAAIAIRRVQHWLKTGK